MLCTLLGMVIYNSSCCSQSRGVGKLEVVDRDNGLTLRLILEKSQYTEGEIINTTVCLESAHTFAIHKLNITPQYLATPAVAKDESVDMKEISLGWRNAYYYPMFLTQKITANFCPGTLLYSGPYVKPAETKKAYLFCLGGAKYGDFFPRDTILGDCTITVKKSFKATKDKDIIDVGLFSQESFYTPGVLSVAGSLEYPSKNRYRVKLPHKIWMGSVYVSQRITVSDASPVKRTRNSGNSGDAIHKSQP